jgi:hypothetical protein
MHFVLESDDATVLGRMHDQRIAAIDPDVVSVSGVERYEMVAASRFPRPTRKIVAELDRSTLGSMDFGVVGPEGAASQSAVEPSTGVEPTSRRRLARHNI